MKYEHNNGILLFQKRSLGVRSTDDGSIFIYLTVLHILQGSNSFTKITINLADANPKIIKSDLQNDYKGCSSTMIMLHKVLTL